jgi:type III secretory pathway component EscU
MEIPTNLALALWFHRARTPATILLKRGADAQRVFLGRRHPGKFVLIP